MILPDTIDTDHLDEVTDDELLEQLRAAGYDQAGAEYVVEVLRGSGDPDLPVI